MRIRRQVRWTAAWLCALALACSEPGGGSSEAMTSGDPGGTSGGTSDGTSGDTAPTSGDTSPSTPDGPEAERPCTEVCAELYTWMFGCSDEGGPSADEIAAQCEEECEGLSDVTLPKLCDACLDSKSCEPCCTEYHCRPIDPDLSLAAMCEPPKPPNDCTEGQKKCFYDKDCGDPKVWNCNSVTSRCTNRGWKDCAGTPCQYNADCPSNSCNKAEGKCN